MGRLNWNYAGRARWNRRWLAAGIIAFTGCTHALWWRDTLLTQRNAVVERADRLSRRTAVQQQPALPIPAALDPVFTEMRYPWMTMLDSLTAATPPGVDLLTLEPNAGAIRRVRIGGTANQTQRVFDLIDTLNQDPAWSSVQLVSQTRNSDPNPSVSRDSVPPLPSLPGLSDTSQHTLSFSLLAEWKRP
ncbi:PilN domain-containing protein [Burkholderia sp. BCC0397]|uniref:PilN domain-containing protein n=1 Tax=Burkholderia sp. BCC0397 TaxID=486876 RepID=UPI00158AAFF6|nr:PilN domain-containing protein [Burkholderia sp. BCC0397]